MRLFGFGRKENKVEIEEPEDDGEDGIPLEDDLDVVLSHFRAAIAAGYVDAITKDTPPDLLAAQCDMTEEDFKYHINNIVHADLKTFAKVILVLKMPFVFKFKHHTLYTAVNGSEISDDSN